eukprot:8607399-Heterocapsa_arctica.AAC.1
MLRWMAAAARWRSRVARAVSSAVFSRSAGSRMSLISAASFRVALRSSECVILLACRLPSSAWMASWII